MAPAPLSDAPLIRAAKQRLCQRGQWQTCDSVWRRFHARYDRYVRRVIVSRGVAPQDLEDCLQNVWTAVVVRLPSFEYEPQQCRFRTWLYRVARNQAVAFLRARHGRREQPISAKALRALCARQRDPPAEIEHREEQEMLSALLAELRARIAPAAYQVFRLRQLEGWSVSAVGEKLGLEASAVRVLSFRARSKLRQLAKGRRSSG